MNAAHDEFVGGTTYTDSITVATADGTTQVITVTIQGTNDAAVITGASTANLTETNAALTHQRRPRRHRRGQLGDLRGADRRGRQQRLRHVRDRRRRAPGPTRCSRRTTSSWAATTYTDSITVATADGTTQVITVTIHGTNDAAVITGASTASLTETNAAHQHRRHLTTPTWTARRPSWRRADVAGNGYGTFAIDAGGRVDLHDRRSAHNEFVGGDDLHRQLHGGDGRRHDAGRHRHHPGHQRRGGDHAAEHGEPDRDQCGADAPAATSTPPTWTARRPSWRRATWPAATATARSRSTPPAPGPTR